MIAMPDVRLQMDYIKVHNLDILRASSPLRALCNRPLRRSVTMPSSTATRRNSADRGVIEHHLAQGIGKHLHHSRTSQHGPCNRCFRNASQPLPWNDCSCVSSSGENPASTRPSQGRRCGSLQRSQIRRTRRCAQTRLIELFTRNARYPCSRDGSRCSARHSCEASRGRMARQCGLYRNRRGFQSRISPTRITFGSCRRNDRSADANVRPICVANLNLVDARHVEFDGISAVMMLLPG